MKDKEHGVVTRSHKSKNLGEKSAFKGKKKTKVVESKIYWNKVVKKDTVDSF